MSARDYTPRHPAPISRRPVGPAIVAVITLAIVAVGIGAGLATVALWGPSPAVWVTP